MKYYSYKVARDYGFAPNPFGGVCTLATCKPGIRKYADVNDWIIGTGTKKYGLEGQLIFAMEVTEKMTFNQYWNDPRFQFKKPIFNGSLKQTYGDNIYHRESSGDWHQENSHHSYEDGKTNYLNLNRDTKSDNVLISSNFYYFGDGNIEIPEEFGLEICIKKQGYKKIKLEIAERFIQWLQENYEPGYNGDPILFEKFERYDGK